MHARALSTVAELSIAAIAPASRRLVSANHAVVVLAGDERAGIAESLHEGRLGAAHAGSIAQLADGIAAPTCDASGGESRAPMRAGRRAADAAGERAARHRDGRQIDQHIATPTRDLASLMNYRAASVHLDP